MNLHLRYRLWIAEMNFDINVLRIFHEYLGELGAKKGIAEVQKGIEQFEARFAALRKEIDDLKNEMHLVKMTLAAYAREKKAMDEKTYQSENHIPIKKRYTAFREEFEKAKEEFGEFESKWLE